MPETLKDTLRSAIAETKTPQQPIVQETAKESAPAASAEPKSGEPAEKEYVSGIDISELPEQERPTARRVLSEKAKLLETGYNQKFREIADYKRERDAFTQMGITMDEAKDALSKYAESKKNPVSQTAVTADKKQALKTLDKLIDSAPIEQRGALEQMRQIIKEEAPVDVDKVAKLEEKISQFEKFMSRANQETSSKRQNDLHTELDSLKTKYGDEFVEKYRDDIVTNGLKYGGSARQLLHAISPADELEQAITVKLKPGKQITTEKANAITSSTPGLTSSAEQINTKQSYGGLLRDVIRLGSK